MWYVYPNQFWPQTIQSVAYDIKITVYTTFLVRYYFWSMSFLKRHVIWAQVEPLLIPVLFSYYWCLWLSSWWGSFEEKQGNRDICAAKARLHQASGTTLQQLDDASNTVPIENNGIAWKWVVIPFWSYSIVFSENNIAGIIAALSQHWHRHLV